jgi:hypothetical protein
MPETIARPGQKMTLWDERGAGCTGAGHPSQIAYGKLRSRFARLSREAGAPRSDGTELVLRPHDRRRVFASEHLNNNTPIHVIQALRGDASPDTVMIYARLYPTTLVDGTARPSARPTWTSTAPTACTHRTPRNGGTSPRRSSCATWCRPDLSAHAVQPPDRARARPPRARRPGSSPPASWKSSDQQRANP